MIKKTMAMDVTNRFINFIHTEKLLRKNDLLLLAVSGGVDSVVLCELCKQAGLAFVIAHCNFRLRGAESNWDEVFVTELGKKYGVPVLVKQFDTEDYAAENKISIQVAARILRYEWFNDLLVTTPTASTPTTIVTAHHADDNTETVLMNIFKGTGIQGLKGILPRHENLVRPLLFASKKEITDFAVENNLSWVEDSSNLSDKYTRNFFRHQIIPLISKAIPEAAENMTGNIQRFREVVQLYDQAIELHKKKLLEYKENNVEIPVKKLLLHTPLHTIVYEIIRHYGFNAKQTEEVVALLYSETGKYVLSATHRILKNRNRLLISPLTEEKNNLLLIEKEDTELLFQGGRLQISTINKAPTTIENDNNIALLDAKNIQFPLLLRKWKTGDYFYPLGMRKKKKLARFFIDKKLSLLDKENVWVMESAKKIIWVVGFRIDDRFKITESTREVLKIHWTEI